MHKKFLKCSLNFTNMPSFHQCYQTALHMARDVQSIFEREQQIMNQRLCILNFAAPQTELNPRKII